MKDLTHQEMYFHHVDAFLNWVGDRDRDWRAWIMDSFYEDESGKLWVEPGTPQESYFWDGQKWRQDSDSEEEGS